MFSTQPCWKHRISACSLGTQATTENECHKKKKKKFGHAGAAWSYFQGPVSENTVCRRETYGLSEEDRKRRQRAWGSSFQYIEVVKAFENFSKKLEKVNCHQQLKSQGNQNHRTHHQREKIRRRRSRVSSILLLFVLVACQWGASKVHTYCCPTNGEPFK